LSSAAETVAAVIRIDGDHYTGIQSLCMRLIIGGWKGHGRKLFIPSHNPSPRLQVGPLRTLIRYGGIGAPQEVSVGRLLGYSTSPILHLEISSGCDSADVSYLGACGNFSGFTEY